MAKMFKFSDMSQARLKTCDDRLQLLFNHIIMEEDCSILCGHREKEAQDKAYNEGFSKVQWPNSKHNSYPSKAVDVLPYPINWMDHDRIALFASKVKAKAVDLGIKIRWGGDFKSFKDMPHFELED